MAKLAIIKEANTVAKKVGDVIQVFDDSYLSTPYEQQVFTWIHVPGFTRIELKAAMPYPELKEAFRLPIAGKWTLEEPETTEVWKYPADGKWYFRDYGTKGITKYWLSITSLNSLELEQLQDEKVDVLVKKAILMKLKQRAWDDPTHRTQCADLNTAQVEM